MIFWNFPSEIGHYCSALNYRWLITLMAIIIVSLFCLHIIIFAASQLASLIIGDERKQVTYTTSYLPTSTLIEWIKNGNKFSTTQFKTMTNVSVTDGVSVWNS
jgi:hypothetical protein